MSNSKVTGFTPVKPKKLLEHYPWKVGDWCVDKLFSNRHQVLTVKSLDYNGNIGLVTAYFENGKPVYCSTNY